MCSCPPSRAPCLLLEAPGDKARTSMRPDCRRCRCLSLLAIIFAAKAATLYAFQLPPRPPRIIGATWRTSSRQLRVRDPIGDSPPRKEYYPADRTILPRSSMSLPPEGAPASRARVIGIALSWVGLMTAIPPPGRALDPVKKFQEQMRIRAQEEFDNVEALASPEGGKTIQPVLTLVPIVR